MCVRTPGGMQRCVDRNKCDVKEVTEWQRQHDVGQGRMMRYPGLQMSVFTVDAYTSARINGCLHLPGLEFTWQA